MSDHPGPRTLARFGEGLGEPEERALVARHLEACARCGAELEVLRQLGPALAALPDRSAPEGLWGRIEEGLRSPAAAADRRGRDSGAPRERWRPTSRLGLAAGVAALAALSLFLMARPSSMAAGTSVLEVSRVGTVGDAAGKLDLVYRTSGRLADRETLSGRARVWRWTGRAPEFSEPEIVAGTLARTGPGAFEGKVEVPPGTVFAWLAVEDETGTTIDLGRWPRWEFLAGGAEPTREASYQRLRAYSEVHPALALELSREFTTRFPHDPLGWSLRAAFELRSVSPARRPSLLEELRATARDLDERIGAREIEAETAAAMWSLARRLELTDLQERWAERLQRFPHHPVAVERRVSELVRSHAGKPRSRLESLEAEWEPRREPDGTSLLGFQAALAVGDPREVRRWGLRVVESWPRDIPSVARRFADFPSLLGDAARLARTGLDRLAAEGIARPLERTRQKHDIEVERVRARLLIALGAALAGSGDRAAARDTLALATSSVWEPDLFRSASSSLLAIGDTARAAVQLARLAVDPSARTPPRARDIPPLGLRAARWERLLAEARSDFERTIRKTLDDVGLTGSIETPDGRRGTLSELTGAAPLVVLAFFHILEPEASMHLDRIPEERSGLREAGIPLLAVVGSPPVDDPDALARVADRYGIDVYHDVAGDVMSTVHRWPAATYFVLERGSRIRYGGDIGGALRTAILLSRDHRTPPASGD